MLSTSNSKLGKIANWSIPAIKTCPGKSKFCASLCYADKGFYKMNNVQASHAKNYALSLGDTFEKDMIAYITKKKCPVVRIHVAGDFYSAEYTQKWVNIVKACPKTAFYAYTRSWRVANIVSALTALADLPNMQLWLSVDKETGKACDIPKTTQAYLSSGDEDAPTWPVDLVFRAKTITPQKKLGGAIICPYEQGAETDVTCQTCRICFKAPLKQLLQLGKEPVK